MVRVMTTPRTNADHPTPIADPRSALELLVGLAIAVLLVRAFIAEAFLVPSGSMAPTLLGFHQDIDCPVCGRRIQVGLEETGKGPVVVDCPACGRRDIGTAGAPVGRSAVCDIAHPLSSRGVVVRASGRGDPRGCRGPRADAAAGRSALGRFFLEADLPGVAGEGPVE